MAGMVVHAQLSFGIEVLAREMGKDDVLEVAYVVKGTMNAGNFSEPVFKQWQIIHGPSQSMEETNINGRSSASTKLIYGVKPVTTGSLTLPGISVKANGKVLTCAAVTINVKSTPHVLAAGSGSGLQIAGGHIMQDRLPRPDVLDNSTILKPGETITSKVKANIFIRVYVSRKSCVVGEPILVTYKLCTRLAPQAKVAKQPTFNGCSVQEMTTDDLLPETENINGKDYRTYVIRKVQLTPLQAGKLVLDAAAVENTLTMYKAGTTSRDLYYGNAETVTETVVVQNTPESIDVLPLPAEGKPVSFKGAIGSFTVTALVDKANDTANENNNLKLVIEGNGNFQSVALPVINWPAHIDHYDATEREELNKLVFPVTGSKVFNVPFVAKHEGRIAIPSIAFSFYDVQSREYKTLQTDSLVIQVAKANPSSFDASKISQDVTNRKFIWLVPCIALVAMLVMWWKYGYKPKKQAPAIVAAAPLQEEEAVDTTPVASIEEQEQERKQLYDAIQALHFAADNKAFCIAARRIAEELLQKHPSGAALQQVIATCNECLYAPFEVSVDKQLILQQLQSYV